MLINISDPIFQTVIFSGLMLVALLFTLKKKKPGELFPRSLTNELKGVAILAVIFAHVGYFLFTDTRFIFPLSVLGGVGVNIFLFLSGYGLAVSSAKKELSVGQFYLRRLSKIIVPFWLSLVAFFVIDHFFLHLNYGLVTMVENFLGFFPTNDLYRDLNSPLWFITLIIFYYLIFPFFFSRRRPLLSALGIFVLGWIFTSIKLPVGSGVLGAYQVHFVAFPLGLLAFVLLDKINIVKLLPLKLLFLASRLRASWTVFFETLIAQKYFLNFLYFLKKFRFVYYIVTVLILLAIIFYTALIHSGVGQGAFPEQTISLITVICFVLLFMVRKTESRFLTLLGAYSFEIYLIHWPIMYRYDFLYRYLPAATATFLYIFIFILLGFVMRTVCTKLSRLIFRIS
ncbi:MAG: acyltransferase family protein [Patescibacteria group bacterium]